jgi:2-polyprenyl-6-methoxyphenol hydroxylase-like FAD-dependent oxidoreductase
LVLLLSHIAADGWWSAVRHIGCVMGLKPNEDAFDSFGLPYPDLAVTISTIRMEPAANMWEHFNTPGVYSFLFVFCVVFLCFIYYYLFI